MMPKLNFRFPFSRSIQSYILGRVEKAYLDNQGWRFDEIRAGMAAKELPDWKLNYRPIDLRGKTVLDVGAGQGETAKFFLHSGARRVVALEADESCFRFLAENSKRFPITPLYKRFEVSDLWREGLDFAKVDIEGYEEIMLGSKPPIPVAVEIHGLQLRDKFIADGWRVNKVGFGAYCICYGFWKC